MLSVQHVTVQNRLNNVSVEMHSGECWHVLGQNGAGKTSLFELIAGLERALLFLMGEKLTNSQ
jgi:vitamin B12 transport system ATP-binding protein